MKVKLPRSISLLGVFRWQLLGLVFFASLLSAVLLGCGGVLPSLAPPPTPTPTPPPIEQLIAETSKATNAAKTLKFDMDIDMIMNTIGGQKPMTFTIAMNGTGVANIANKEMQADISMNIDMQELGKQKITMQEYVVGGYSYIKMAIPGAGDQWMKMKLTDQMWRNEMQVDQQVALLAAAAKPRIVGTEDVSGTQAYVVEYTPDMQAVSKLMGQTQTSGLQGLDFAKLGADLYKDTTVKYWISRDNYLLTKLEMQMTGEIPSSALGTAILDFDKMGMDLHMKTNYIYDQPVSITLPQEAQGAKEIPSPFGQ